MGIINDAVDFVWGGIKDVGCYLLDNLDVVAFLILAFIAVLAALKVVQDKEVIHSAFYLALVFLCVGFVYFFLEAEFIAVVQLLVYVGAITILFAFSIMLTRRYIMKKGGDSE